MSAKRQKNFIPSVRALIQIAFNVNIADMEK